MASATIGVVCEAAITAAAKVSGESSVYGVTSPARIPMAVAVPESVNVTTRLPVRSVIAPIELGPTVNTLSAFPDAFRTPGSVAGLTVNVNVQSPTNETMS